MDITMPVAEDLCDEELTLFEENYEEIFSLKLKIFKLHTDKLYGLNVNQHLQQEIKKAKEDIVKVQARTTMQNHLQKIESCNNSFRAVDIFLQFKLDLVEKEIKYYQEVKLETVDEKCGTLEREIERLENKQINIIHVLMDNNHHKREGYLLEIMGSFAENVAKLLVNQPIDEDELKVALCIFEIQNEEIDDCDYKNFELGLYKAGVPEQSNAYRKIVDETSDLESEVKTIRESLNFRSTLRTIQRLTN